MYRQVFIPSKKTHSIAIPREWYGQEVELIAFPTQQQRSTPPCQFTVEEARKLVRQSVKDAKVGLGTPHEEVMQRMDELLARLKQRQQQLEEEFAL